LSNFDLVRQSAAINVGHTVNKTERRAKAFWPSRHMLQGTKADGLNLLLASRAAQQILRGSAG